MSNESKECWQCRLISGGGLLGASAYIIFQGKKLKGFQRRGVTIIGYGVGIIGALRLFGFPPFDTKRLNDEIITEKEDEYIVGKFTSRYN